jgi:hypothetical protein
MDHRDRQVLRLFLSDATIPFFISHLIVTDHYALIAFIPLLWFDSLG